MGRKLKNLTGMKFGKLTVLNEYKRVNGITYWLCECDCDDKTKKYIQYSNLFHSTVSCGCIREELDMNKKHGYAGTRIFTIWKNMMRRCNDERDSAYNNYGRRGIKIFNGWLIEEDYEGLLNFIAWAKGSGYSDNPTIDRINVDGDYTPENCKWSSYEEQNNNRRNNVYIEINGELKTQGEWAKYSGLTLKQIHSRVRRGWSGEDIIKPIVKRKSEKQSGEKHVVWDSKNKKWAVRIKRVSLGYFDDLEDAIQAKQDYINKLNTHNGEDNACSSTK
jgi:hypothetical protein